MAQYPIPPADREESREPFSGPREIRYDADAPRFRHLPLVRGRADGSFDLVRGDAALAARLVERLSDPVRGFSESRMLSGAGAGADFFVLWNRLDRLTFLEAGVEHVAGAVEMALYTVPYRRHVRLAQARSFDELRGMLRAELDFLDAVEADGWELVGRPGNRGGEQHLVDTRRPDEGDLRADELPDPWSLWMT